jgi:hypothetical protein
MRRGPRKVKVDCGRPEMYRLYKKSSDKPVSSNTYSAILNDFNKAVSKEILENAFEYIVPFRLGILRIKKYKAHYKIDEETGKIIGNPSPNWKATKELWARSPKAKEEKKLVYHINEHSDGYQYKWYFSNYRSNCINKSAYCFIPSRTNKRRLAELIKDEEFDGDFYM